MTFVRLNKILLDKVILELNIFKMIKKKAKYIFVEHYFYLKIFLDILITTKKLSLK